MNRTFFILAICLIVPIHVFAQTKCFRNYKEVFAFIAIAERIVASNDDIYDLTADSTIHRYYSQSEKLKGWIIVIEANLYGLCKYNKVRGAQLNGRYYVFHVKKNCYHYLGKLEGKMLKTEYKDGLPVFKTFWHLSSDEVPPSVYTFNGSQYTLLD